MDIFILVSALSAIVLFLGYVPLLWGQKKKRIENKEKCAPCTAIRLEQCLVLLRRIQELLEEKRG